MICIRKNENICIKSPPLNAKLFRDQVIVPLNGKEKNILTCVMRIGAHVHITIVFVLTHAHTHTRQTTNKLLLMN